ncbi:MAG TPA: glycosyltransferase family 39 protein [Verrucomicrobiae bacterium]|nr:glycosyltransferase family 39 protein [Verrucomicrobiae bacterium]
MSFWFDKLAAKPQRSVLLLGLLLLLAGNAILPMTDRDEARFSEASREMIQRGDYVVPWFNDAWRFDKPVLIYWCQIASYKIFGVNEFAARLPTSLFCIGTSLLLVRWGQKVSGNRTALIAGVMFLTGLHVAVVIGRVATADMAMIFFCTLAAWSGWELTRPEQPSRKTWWWIFYLALALGFLAKGPVAWLPLGGMLLGRALRPEMFRLPLLETLVGLIVAVAVASLWGIPALMQTGGKFWSVGMGEHVFNRSVGVINGHGPKDAVQYILTLPLYFLTFFASFFPWSITVPGSLKRWWPLRYRDDLGWFLLINAMLVFIVFSLVKTKLPHYTMPAFPLIALWLARQISDDVQLPTWFTRRLVAMVIIVLAVTLGGFTFARNHLLTQNLWNATQAQVRPETKIGCFGFIEPSLVWKFRAVSTNYITLGTVGEAENFLTNTPPFILVVPTESLAKISDTNGTLISVRGLDVVKFKNRNLTAIVH